MVALVVLGLLVGLGLGFLAARMTVPVATRALVHRHDVRPSVTVPRAPLRDGRSGIEVLAADLTGAPVLSGWVTDTPVRRQRGTTAVAAGSRIADEVARLGLLRSSFGSVYRMHLRSPLGAGRQLMEAAGGGNYGDVVGPGGKAVEKAKLERVSFSEVVSPQLLWSLGALAVGQHFQAVISMQLETINTKLSVMMAKAVQKDFASIEAARKELGVAATRLLDGTDPGLIEAGLSAQVQAIGTGWQQSLDWLSHMDEGLSEVRDDPTNAQLERRLPELFNLHRQGEFFVDARLFLAALVAHAQLQLFRAGAMASDGGDQAHSNFANHLRAEAAGCSEAYDRFLAVVAKVARLELRPDGFRNTGGGYRRAVGVLQEMLRLEDLLRDLRLPLMHDVTGFYELDLRRTPDGAVVIEFPQDRAAARSLSVASSTP